MIKRIAPVLLLLAFLPLQLHAQQIGASVTGHVLDPSGAAISGASVKLTSTITGAVYPTVSDSAGLYQLPFVLIGNYTLSVQKEGFKKHEQAGITLIGDQKADIDVTLQLGAVTQTVNVTADATILQTESGDRTATIDNFKIDAEVLRGQNAIVTTWFTPGVEVTSGDQKIRPWDNAGTQAESFNGGQDGNGGNLQTGQNSGNLLMVDGISSNRGGVGTGFNLMASAADQVIVQATQFDAEEGWTTGGYVNTLSKSGSNTWHGHGYDHLQNTILNAEDWGQQHGGPGGTNAGRAPWHFNYFGGEVGGPIKKNKIFVFYAFQQMWSIQHDPYTISIPTQAERQGNFQGLCGGALSNGNCAQVQLYDPATEDTTGATTNCNAVTNTTPCRSQIGPNFLTANVINPASINPIAAKMLSYVPQPVLTGNLLPCGTDVSGQSGPTAGLCGGFSGNKSNDAQSRKFVDFFPQHNGRIDWNFNDATKAFFRFSKNDLAETRSYVYSTTASINPMESSGNNPLFRGNQAYALEVTRTINPTTVLELRTGMDRYPNGGGDTAIKQLSPSALGFSSTWQGLTGPLTPQISFTSAGGATAYNQLAGTLPSYTASDIWTHSATLAHTMNKHNLRVGWQRFDLADYSEGPGAINGAFTFNGTFTQANPNAPIGATLGNPIADFLLGLPQAASINQPTYPEYWMHEESLWAQDDWHVNRKLTVNLGIRWDYEGPVHEKYNRLLNNFCFQCGSPMGSVAQYTNAFTYPATGGTAYSFTFPQAALLGGPTFAGTSGSPSGIFNPKYDNFGPRLGFAYDAGHDIVLRGGWGILYGQQFLELGAAPGFSGSTTALIQPGFPGVFNPNISFANPIQTGLLPIVGSAYGLGTNMGNSISFPDPNMDVPRTMQYDFEIQKRVGKDWMFTLAYVGSKTNRLNVNQNLNYVPLADLPYTPNFTANTSAPGGGGLATTQFLNQSITNPFTVPAQFAAETKGTYVTGSKVGQGQLLYQYPQFSQVTEDWEPIGRSHYNAMQFEVIKRFSYGLDFSANVTWSKTLQALGFINAQDPFPRQTISQNDMPRHFTMNFVYHAPFGPGQKFLNNPNPLISRLVSGWQISATPMLEDGEPAPTPSGLQPLGSAKTAHPTLLHWFNTCYINAAGNPTDCSIDSTPAWRQTVANQLYEWGPYMHGVRYVGVHDLQLGIRKDTKIKERYTLSIAADMINALNSAQFFGDLQTSFTSTQFGEAGHPAFTPSDDPRVIELYISFQF